MFETIAWATDGSESADATLRVVTELARIHGSCIVALHCAETLHPHRGSAPLYAEDDGLRRKIAEQVTDLRHAGFTAEFKIGRGAHDSAALIASAAAELGADLIVIGLHSHGAMSGLLTHVSEGLLRLAACPVLAVPPLEVLAAEPGKTIASAG